MKKYFLDDKSIDALVKSIVKKLFESPNYISLRNTISSLRTDLDKVSTSSNEVVECKAINVYNGTNDVQLTFSYPAGFNKDNTIIIGNYSSMMNINSNIWPGSFKIDYVRFGDSQFIVSSGTSNSLRPGGNMYVYVMKKPSG